MLAKLPGAVKTESVRPRVDGVTGPAPAPKRATPPARGVRRRALAL